MPELNHSPRNLKRKPPKKAQDERLPSGSIIHWPKRNPKDPEQVKVTCGRCGRNRWVCMMTKAKPKGWTGFCRNCQRLKHTQDQKLKTGSIVHWSERDLKNTHLRPVTCGKCGKKRWLSISPSYITSETFTGCCPRCGHQQYRADEVLPSGSIIHWSERDPHDKSRRPATCGRCGKKRWVNNIHALYVRITRRSRTGLCGSCAALARHEALAKHGDETLPSGSIIHWSDRNPENSHQVRVTCGRCHVDRFTWPVKHSKGSPWTAFCRRCSQLKLEDEPHPSGAVIHWSERDPKDSDHKTPFTCWKCKKKSFTWIFGRARAKWLGLCSDCGREGQKRDRKFTGDQILPGSPGFQSIIHWDERDPKNSSFVMVTCGLCKEKRPISITAFYPAGRKSPINGYCRKHRNDLASLPSLLIAQAQQGEIMSNGAQQNQTAKKRRGPKKGHQAIITEEGLRRAFAELGSYAGQEKVAEFLNVTDRAIRKWQKKRKWREVQEQYSKTGTGL